ncbi:hypothetical protein ACFSHQ_21515 [Gemmobacter lanyuensis]
MKVWGLAAVWLGVMAGMASGQSAGWQLIDPGGAGSTRRITIQGTEPLACGMFTPALPPCRLPAFRGRFRWRSRRAATLRRWGKKRRGGLSTGSRRHRNAAICHHRRGRSLQLAESGAAGTFVEALLTADLLTVRIDAANKVPAEATFLLPGLEAALAEMLRRCGG